VTPLLSADAIGGKVPEDVKLLPGVGAWLHAGRKLDVLVMKGPLGRSAQSTEAARCGAYRDGRECKGDARVGWDTSEEHSVKRLAAKAWSMAVVSVSGETGFLSTC